MNKPRNFCENTYHHLYNRGVNKQSIFLNNENYQYFLQRICYYKDKYKIELLAYCLMPNHFHLFVLQPTKQNSIMDFISGLTNSYTKAFNKCNDRSGVLFGSKTQSKQIIDKVEFKWLIKYILENPVKAGLVNEITDWEYSNAQDLFGIRKVSLCNIDLVKSFFQSESKMLEFLSNQNMEIQHNF